MNCKIPKLHNSTFKKLVDYTMSSDSAPSISAILRLVLIEKLPKSSFSALLELNRNSFPSDQCSFLAHFKQCSLNQCSVFVGPKRALSEDLVYCYVVVDIFTYIVKHCPVGLKRYNFCMKGTEFKKRIFVVKHYTFGR